LNEAHSAFNILNAFINLVWVERISHIVVVVWIHWSYSSQSADVALIVGKVLLLMLMILRLLENTWWLKVDIVDNGWSQLMRAADNAVCLVGFNKCMGSHIWGGRSMEWFIVWSRHEIGRMHLRGINV
jgi:hypothetical protein